MTNLDILQKCTWLPLDIIRVAGGLTPTLVVQTPQMGEVNISFKSRTYGFFSAGGEVEKTIDEVLREIKDIEKEADEFLIQAWLAKNAAMKEREKHL